MDYTQYALLKSHSLASIVTDENGNHVLIYEGFDPISGEKVTTASVTLGDYDIQSIQTQAASCQQNITNTQANLDSLTSLLTDIQSLTTS